MSDFDDFIENFFKEIHKEIENDEALKSAIKTLDPLEKYNETEADLGRAMTILMGLTMLERLQRETKRTVCPHCKAKVDNYLHHAFRNPYCGLQLMITILPESTKIIPNEMYKACLSSYRLFIAYRQIQDGENEEEEKNEKDENGENKDPKEQEKSSFINVYGISLKRVPPDIKDPTEILKKLSDGAFDRPPVETQKRDTFYRVLAKASHENLITWSQYNLIKSYFGEKK